MHAVAPLQPLLASPHQLLPLTERILHQLPGSRRLMILIWASVPWLNAAFNLLLGAKGTSPVWEQSTALVVLNYAALSLGVVVTVCGAGRIARRLERLRAEIGAVADEAADEFRAMNSAVGPIVAAVVMAAGFAAVAYDRGGWDAALVRGVSWLILGIAFWSFIWTYASLQLGLERLGRERLLPEAARIVDPAVEMQPLGNLAFAGLWMLLIWLVPVVLTGLPDIPGFVVGISLLAAALGVFFLSLTRLHRQIVEMKDTQLTLARDLFGQAYAPVRAQPTLEVLDAQRNLLGAADSLERRAHAIHEWPIDEGTFARVLTITTSVIAMAFARLLLDPLGL